MSLQEFIKKNKDKENELRCGSCNNSLPQCGKYTIEKVGMGQGKRSEEGILCESCKQKDRKLVNITRIFESPNSAVKNVANFRIADLNVKPEEEQNKLDQYKKLEVESVSELQTKPVENKAIVKQEKQQQVESKDKNSKKDD